MSRKRFVHPNMWQDGAIAKMTRDERLLFVGMVTVADDEGRLLASPAHLLGAIYPTDEVTPKQVRGWRDGITTKATNVVLYEVDGREYVAFKKWSEYNAPNHAVPSKIPPPSRGGK